MKRNATAAAERKKRKKDLEFRARAIVKAVEAYQELDRQAGEKAEGVRIRNVFFRRDEDRPDPDPEVPYADRREDDLKSRPPMTRLIHRHGNALPVYLSAIYTAHLTHQPGVAVKHSFHNTYGTATAPSWATLVGLDGDDRPRERKDPKKSTGVQKRGANNPRVNRHRNLTRALATLAEQRLITAGSPGTGRFKTWTLQREDAAGYDYEVPGREARRVEAITLPFWFFLNGWHLVLEPTEIAVFFAIVERSQTLPLRQRDAGVALPASTRWRRLGLSDEAYLSAHNLADFGLITLVKPKPGDDDSPEPLRFHYPARIALTQRAPALRDRPALDVVQEDLDHEWPERMYEHELFGPRAMKSWASLTRQPGTGTPARS